VRQGSGLSGEVDVVIASMSPFETAEAAARLSHALGKPWVADLRDPWALDEMTVYPTRLHQRREQARMGRLLRTASAVVANTPEAARRIRRQLPEIARVPVVAIPNGFDASDFAPPAPPRSDGRFRIVHTGSLHTDIGTRQRTARLQRLLGGSADVDILPRSHVYLLQAIDRLIARDSVLGSRIEVILAGVLSRTDLEIADRSAVVRTRGFLPHDKTIALMRSADLLFLPMYKLPPGRRSGIVPGKAYEYLAAQRPILAAVPAGDARDILVEAGSAHICEPDDVAAMAAAIEGQLTGLDEKPARVADAVLHRFERRALTAELAVVLDAVADRRPNLGAIRAVRTEMVA
jgi:glycosyltransferase involved in cell wall biosynthesis